MTEALKVIAKDDPNSTCDRHVWVESHRDYARVLGKPAVQTTFQCHCGGEGFTLDVVDLAVAFIEPI